MNELIFAIEDVFRASFNFYYTAHAFHWNVLGASFNPFHEFFETIYSDTYGALDDLAEAMRRLDGLAPQYIGPLGPTGPVLTEPMQMCAVLTQLNDELLSKLGATLIMANDANEQGVLNLLAERQFAHEKFRWMLKATQS